MTVVRDYEDLTRLLDQLTPEGLQELRRHALRLVREQKRAAPEPDADRTPLFAGVIEDGPPDLAESVDEYLEERFNYHS